MTCQTACKLQQVCPVAVCDVNSNCPRQLVNAERWTPKKSLPLQSRQALRHVILQCAFLRQHITGTFKKPKPLLRRELQRGREALAALVCPFVGGSLRVTRPARPSIAMSQPSMQTTGKHDADARRPPSCSACRMSVGLPPAP